MLVRVDPAVLVTDGEDLHSVATRLRSAVGSAGGSLSGTQGMAGDDPSADDFASAYDEKAPAILEEAAAIVSLLSGLDNAISGTARAYDLAEGVGAGRSGSPIPASGSTLSCSAPSVPTALGAGLPSVLGDVQDFIQDALFAAGIVIPNGDPGTLRSAASAWSSLESDVRSVKSSLSSSLTALASMDIPQKADILACRDRLEELLDQVVSDADSLRDVCEGQADAIADAHREILWLIGQMVAEIAITAGLGFALSFVTFGGAGAVAAAKVAHTIARFVPKILTVIQKLRSFAVARAALLRSLARISGEAARGSVAAVAVTASVNAIRAGEDGFESSSLTASGIGAFVSPFAGTPVSSAVGRTGGRVVSEMAGGAAEGVVSEGVNLAISGDFNVQAVGLSALLGPAASRLDSAATSRVTPRGGASGGATGASGVTGGSAADATTPTTPDVSSATAGAGAAGGAGTSTGGLPSGGTVGSNAPQPAPAGGSAGTGGAGTGGAGAGAGGSVRTDSTAPQPGVGGGGGSTASSGGAGVRTDSTAPQPGAGGGGASTTPTGGAGDIRTDSAAPEPGATDPAAPAAPTGGADVAASPAASVAGTGGSVAGADATTTAPSPVGDAAEAGATSGDQTSTPTQDDVASNPASSEPTAATSDAVGQGGETSESDTAETATSDESDATSAETEATSADTASAEPTPPSDEASGTDAAERQSASDDVHPSDGDGDTATAASVQDGITAASTVDASDVAAADHEITEAIAAETAAAEAAAADEAASADASTPDDAEGAATEGSADPVGAAADSGSVTPRDPAALQELTAAQHEILHGTATAGDGWTRYVETHQEAQDLAANQTLIEGHGHLGPTYAPQDAEGNIPEHADSPVHVGRGAQALGFDSSEVWGHGPRADGTEGPYSREDWESRNILPDGKLRWAPNTGAVAGSRVVYSDGQAFLRDWGGLRLDRLGSKESGTYFGLGGGSFNDRALPPMQIKTDDLWDFEFLELPEGWTVEVSRIGPGYGLDGGGVQLVVRDDMGEAATLRRLLREGAITAPTLSSALSAAP
ncbi:glycohydrolase toxin TNT-related protein [Herbiconiux sp. SYSU D00978]|uniref:glycohydrolase toxin TNT-related protein n=1 Tax=Herbiconiux sp. SYSU D00978 TaxID=2812562 RepID=UPI001A957945|nr:glycohydrolase toxin TNT-related protein [Herbiconiux sp. SYSU D00978]